MIHNEHNEPEKVTDWATDFDHGSQEWADDPYVIVQSLKNSGFSGSALHKIKNPSSFNSPILGRKGIPFDYTPIKK